MSFLSALRAGLHESFFLRGARAKTEEYGEQRLERIRDEKRAARERVRASSRLADAHVALALLEPALDHAITARELAGVEVPSRSTRSEIDDRSLDFAAAETRREEIEVEVARLLRSVESRTSIEIRGLVYGRFIAIFLVLILAVRAGWNHWGLHNVALHKPVMTSPLHPPPSLADGLVDGRTRGTFGVQTESGHPAFVTIDLTRSYRIRRVVVYNRGDGWFDESLPLTLEVSDDNVHFSELARRTEHFDVWTVDTATDARYVRVSKEGGYVALNEIEIYARE